MFNRKDRNRVKELKGEIFWKRRRQECLWW